MVLQLLHCEVTGSAARVRSYQLYTYSMKESPLPKTDFEIDIMQSLACEHGTFIVRCLMHDALLGVDAR